MSDEYLARTSSEFFWMMIVFGVMFVIIIAGIVWSRKEDPEDRLFYKRKFVWAALIPLVGYLYISVPFTGLSYRFAESPKAPETIESTEEARKYIAENSRRIDRLEKEVAEAREDLRQVTRHYQRILNFLMVAFFIYAFGQILKKPPWRPDPMSVINLQD